MRLRTPLLALLGAALSGCATNPPGATTPAAQDQRPSAYQPKRVGPAAMQAWIAPWEDATGDLYPPSTVYIEVDPERWQYSGSPGGRLRVLRPLQVERRAPSAAATPDPGTAPGPAALDGQAPPFFAPPPGRRGA